MKVNKSGSCKSGKVDLSSLKLLRTIEDHSNWVNCLCLLKDMRLASCSWDKTIKIFNLFKLKCDITIIGHKGIITYISEIKENYIASSSWNGEIKVFEIYKNHYQCIKSFQAHNDVVHKITLLTNDRFASCSGDFTVKIWKNDSSYKCVAILKEHTNIVFSVIIARSKKHLISASDDESVVFYDALTYEREKKVFKVGCCSSNSLFELDNNLLVVGKEDMLTFVDVATFQVVTKIRNHNFGNVFSFAQLSNKTVLCGGQGLLFVLDLDKMTVSTSTSLAHDCEISSLVVINNFLISSSWDKTIKIWELY